MSMSILWYVFLYSLLHVINSPLQTMSKLVQREWERYAEETGQVLPKLTASISRKVAVTTLRESGGDRAEQMLLAKHMVHSISTADTYYDKSNQREARSDVIEKITEAYMVSVVICVVLMN